MLVLLYLVQLLRNYYRVRDELPVVVVLPVFYVVVEALNRLETGLAGGFVAARIDVLGHEIADKLLVVLLVTLARQLVRVDVVLAHCYSLQLLR